MSMKQNWKRVAAWVLTVAMVFSNSSFAALAEEMTEISTTAETVSEEGLVEEAALDEASVAEADASAVETPVTEAIPEVVDAETAPETVPAVEDAVVEPETDFLAEEIETDPISDVLIDMESDPASADVAVEPETEPASDIVTEPETEPVGTDVIMEPETEPESAQPGDEFLLEEELILGDEELAEEETSAVDAMMAAGDEAAPGDDQEDTKPEIDVEWTFGVKQPGDQEGATYTDATKIGSTGILAGDTLSIQVNKVDSVEGGKSTKTPLNIKEVNVETSVTESGNETVFGSAQFETQSAAEPQEGKTQNIKANLKAENVGKAKVTVTYTYDYEVEVTPSAPSTTPTPDSTDPGTAGDQGEEPQKETKTAKYQETFEFCVAEYVLTDAGYPAENAKGKMLPKSNMSMGMLLNHKEVSGKEIEARRDEGFFLKARVDEAGTKADIKVEPDDSAEVTLETEKIDGKDVNVVKGLADQVTVTAGESEADATVTVDVYEVIQTIDEETGNVTEATVGRKLDTSTFDVHVMEKDAGYYVIEPDSYLNCELGATVDFSSLKLMKVTGVQEQAVQKQEPEQGKDEKPETPTSELVTEAQTNAEFEITYDPKVWKNTADASAPEGQEAAEKGTETVKVKIESGEVVETEGYAKSFPKLERTSINGDTITVKAKPVTAAPVESGSSEVKTMAASLPEDEKNSAVVTYTFDELSYDVNFTYGFEGISSKPSDFSARVFKGSPLQLTVKPSVKVTKIKNDDESQQPVEEETNVPLKNYTVEWSVTDQQGQGEACCTVTGNPEDKSATAVLSVKEDAEALKPVSLNAKIYYGEEADDNVVAELKQEILVLNPVYKPVWQLVSAVDRTMSVGEEIFLERKMSCFVQNPYYPEGREVEIELDSVTVDGGQATVIEIDGDSNSNGWALKGVKAGTVTLKLTTKVLGDSGKPEVTAQETTVTIIVQSQETTRYELKYQYPEDSDKVYKGASIKIPITLYERDTRYTGSYDISVTDENSKEYTNDSVITVETEKAAEEADYNLTINAKKPGETTMKVTAKTSGDSPSELAVAEIHISVVDGDIYSLVLNNRENVVVGGQFNTSNLALRYYDTNYVPETEKEGEEPQPTTEWIDVNEEGFRVRIARYDENAWDVVTSQEVENNTPQPDVQNVAEVQDDGQTEENIPVTALLRKGPGSTRIYVVAEQLVGGTEGEKDADWQIIASRECTFAALRYGIDVTSSYGDAQHPYLYVGEDNTLNLDVVDGATPENGLTELPDGYTTTWTVSGTGITGEEVKETEAPKEEGANTQSRESTGIVAKRCAVNAAMAGVTATVEATVKYHDVVLATHTEHFVTKQAGVTYSEDYRGQTISLYPEEEFTVKGDIGYRYEDSEHYLETASENEKTVIKKDTGVTTQVAVTALKDAEAESSGNSANDFYIYQDASGNSVVRPKFTALGKTYTLTVTLTLPSDLTAVLGISTETYTFDVKVSGDFYRLNVSGDAEGITFAPGHSANVSAVLSHIICDADEGTSTEETVSSYDLSVENQTDLENANITVNVSSGAVTFTAKKEETNASETDITAKLKATVDGKSATCEVPLHIRDEYYTVNLGEVTNPNLGEVLNFTPILKKHTSGSEEVTVEDVTWSWQGIDKGANGTGTATWKVEEAPGESLQKLTRVSPAESTLTLVAEFGGQKMSFTHLFEKLNYDVTVTSAYGSTDEVIIYEDSDEDHHQTLALKSAEGAGLTSWPEGSKITWTVAGTDQLTGGWTNLESGKLFAKVENDVLHLRGKDGSYTASAKITWTADQNGKDEITLASVELPVKVVPTVKRLEKVETSYTLATNQTVYFYPDENGKYQDVLHIADSAHPQELSIPVEITEFKDELATYSYITIKSDETVTTITSGEAPGSSDIILSLTSKDLNWNEEWETFTVPVTVQSDVYYLNIESDAKAEGQILSAGEKMILHPVLCHVTDGGSKEEYTLYDHNLNCELSENYDKNLITVTGRQDGTHYKYDVEPAGNGLRGKTTLEFTVKGSVGGSQVTYNASYTVDVVGAYYAIEVKAGESDNIILASNSYAAESDKEADLAITTKRYSLSNPEGEEEKDASEVIQSYEKNMLEITGTKIKVAKDAQKEDEKGDQQTTIITLSSTVKGQTVQRDLSVTLCDHAVGTPLEEPTEEQIGSGCKTVTTKSNCTVCGREWTEIKANHEFEPTEAKDPTCTHEGNEAYWYCTICGNYYLDSVGHEDPLTEKPVIKPNGHTFPAMEDAEVTQAPTCTEPGERTYICTVCGGKNPDEPGGVYTEEIAKLGHDPKLVPAVAPTCTVDGSVAYYQCSTCGNNFEDAKGEKPLETIVAKATGHDFDDGVVDPAPTCTTDGVRTFTCKNCHGKEEGGTYTKSVDALGHAPRYVEAVPSDCKVQGTIAHYVCDNCHKNYADATCTKPLEDISSPLAPHNYVVSIQEPTVFTERLAVSVCSVCGDRQETSIGAKLRPTIQFPIGNTNEMKMQVKQTVSKLKVTMAAGDKLKSVKYNKSKSSGKGIVQIKKINTKKGTFNIKAKKIGVAYVTVTLKSGKKQDLKIVVQQDKVTTTSISGVEKKATLKKGAKLQLRPALIPVSSQDTIKYSSSNKKVATVSKTGLVKAKKKGTAKITIKAGKKKFTCKIKVK